MDANGTRYYLLLGRADWATCLTADGGARLGAIWDDDTPSAPTSGLHWDKTRAELTLEPRLFQFVAAPRDTAPSIAQRRGADRDRYGTWYWVADDGRSLRVASAGDGLSAAFWPPEGDQGLSPEPRYGDFAPLEPPAAPARPPLGGLAVTSDHYLVAGVLEPAGLLVFDLFAGGPPRQIRWPDAVPFAPFDMAARPDGGVWVLDRANRRLWALDRQLRVERRDQAELTLEPEAEDDFQPLAGEERTLPALTFPAGVDLDAASPLDMGDPIAVECLPDGTALVLDGDRGADFAEIFAYGLGGARGEPLSTAGMASLIEPGRATNFKLRGHDMAFAPGRVERDDEVVLGQLYLVASDGNQSFAFAVVERAGALRLEALTQYYPMRLFGGKALAGGAAPHYDFGDGWLPLVEQRRPRYADEAALRTPASAGGLVFDGREPDCVWHRVMIDACVPSDAELIVCSRAANTLDELREADWCNEPRPYRRTNGSELPYTEAGPYDTWELLLQQARGRYLQLELRLRGSGRSTPRVRALRAYYPRFSYLRYLPAVYSEEPVAASFLDRFLANLEGFYTALEDKVAAAQVLFDVRAAPPEALDWLASWLGVALDPAWDEARRRLFIRYAPLFFRRRGTIDGLLMALRLVVEDCVDERIFTDPEGSGRAGSIRIVERFRARRIPSVVLGDPSELAGLQVFDPAQRWAPGLGGANLQQRYAAYVADAGLVGELPAHFTPAAPTTRVAEWQAFARAALGFVPSVAATDETLWQDYLARHYRRVEALNDAYRLVGAARHAGFAGVALPAELPPDGAPLQDWYEFQGVTLPTARAAHRFTVMLPMPPGAYERQRERRDLARRVLELEKPAHTTFDLKFYWALFRLGEVRLGFDTLLDRGSRAPELMGPLILGQGHLVETYLAAGRVAPERGGRAGGTL